MSTACAWVCAWVAAGETVCMVADAYDQTYKSWRVFNVSLFWTIAIALLIVGATP